MHKNVRSAALAGLALASAAALLTGCAGAVDPASGASDPSAASSGAPTSNVEDIDLDALVAAANKEGELTVWDSSSSVEDIAALFMEEYPGITVTGTKVSKDEQVTKLSNEAAGGTPSVDVLNFADDGSLGGVLLPQGLATSWFPSDMTDVIPADSQNPAVFVWNPNVFTYNPVTYPDGCPVKNVWELTDDEWAGKVVFEDPSQSPQLADFFTELQLKDTDVLADAYKEHTGSDVDGNAGEAFVAGLAKNAKVAADSDDILGEIGDGGDAIGFQAASSYYDAQDEGFDIAVCEGLSPWIGYASPKFAVLVNKAAHPNAAKLWIHFLLGEKATAPVLDNGGWATNPAVTLPDGVNPIPGMAGDHSDLFRFGLDTIEQDWAMRQDTQDLWAANLSH